MKSKTYLLSFVGGALLHNSSLIVANQYVQIKNWQDVKNKTINENLIQARTQSTLKRIYSEISKRLVLLSDREIDYLVDSSYQEQLYMLWIAVCRRYSYIGDFASEVLRDNFITYKLQVTESDYQTFYLRKSDDHPELLDLTESTQYKIRQVLFRMMFEAGLIDKNNNILTALFTPRLLEIMAVNNYEEIQYFPTLESGSVG